MTDHDMIEWQDGLLALAPFAAVMSDPAFSFGRWHYRNDQADGSISMPWFELTEVAQAFVTAAYAAGWVRPEFDWSNWSHTDEARLLREDPSGLERASPEQLARLITVEIRMDRFVEGELAGAFESGLLGRILARVDELARQVTPSA